MLLPAGLSLASGCGAGVRPLKTIGTPAGPVTLTITGTATGVAGETISHSVTVNVMVN